MAFLAKLAAAFAATRAVAGPTLAATGALLHAAVPFAPAALLALAGLVGYYHDDTVGRVSLGVAAVAAAMVAVQVEHLIRPAK